MNIISYLAPVLIAYASYCVQTGAYIHLLCSFMLNVNIVYIGIGRLSSASYFSLCVLLIIVVEDYCLYV